MLSLVYGNNVNKLNEIPKRVLNFITKVKRISFNDVDSFGSNWALDFLFNLTESRYIGYYDKDGELIKLYTKGSVDNMYVCLSKLNYYNDWLSNVKEVYKYFARISKKDLKAEYFEVNSSSIKSLDGYMTRELYLKEVKVPKGINSFLIDNKLTINVKEGEIPIIESNKGIYYIIKGNFYTIG